MPYKLIITVICFISFNVQAEGLFAKANLAEGKALVEKNCVSCHASSYGGDGSEIYTREFHKVKSAQALVTQVRACNTNIGLKWFEEDELNAAAYLNKMYYKFE